MLIYLAANNEEQWKKNILSQNQTWEWTNDVKQADLVVLINEGNTNTTSAFSWTREILAKTLWVTTYPKPEESLQGSWKNINVWIPFMQSVQWQPTITLVENEEKKNSSSSSNNNNISLVDVIQRHLERLNIQRIWLKGSFSAVVGIVTTDVGQNNLRNQCIRAGFGPIKVIFTSVNLQSDISNPESVLALLPNSLTSEEKKGSILIFFEGMQFPETINSADDHWKQPLYDHDFTNNKPLLWTWRENDWSFSNYSSENPCSSSSSSIIPL